MSDQGREDRHLIDIGAASGPQRASSANMLTGKGDGDRGVDRMPGSRHRGRRRPAVSCGEVSDATSEMPKVRCARLKARKIEENRTLPFRSSRYRVSDVA